MFPSTLTIIKFNSTGIYLFENLLLLSFRYLRFRNGIRGYFDIQQVFEHPSAVLLKYLSDDYICQSLVFSLPLELNINEETGD